MDVSMDQVRQAKATFMETVASRLDVNGVGIGKDERGLLLKVNLSQPPPKGVVVPAKIEGVRVAVTVIGAVSKRDRSKKTTS